MKPPSSQLASSFGAVPPAASGDGRVAVSARGLIKRYEDGRISALDALDLEVEAGAFLAICGPSGCGKSTLLNMFAAIDRPDAGEIEVAGRRLNNLTDNECDRFRSDVVGLVFQLHNLLPHLTALENVQIPMMATGAHPRERVARARSLLEKVGLADRGGSLPTVLSGGERQRVAVARALVNQPRILLADEPTGALDSRTGERLIDLLDALRCDFGMTLIVVTHESRLAERADRVIHMLDGRIVAGGEAN